MSAISEEIQPQLVIEDLAALQPGLMALVSELLVRLGYSYWAERLLVAPIPEQPGVALAEEHQNFGAVAVHLLLFGRMARPLVLALQLEVLLVDFTFALLQAGCYSISVEL